MATSAPSISDTPDPQGPQELGESLKDFFRNPKAHLQSFWERRDTISVRLYFAFFVAAAVTFVTNIIALIGINLIDVFQSDVNERNVPQLIDAFGVSQLSSELSGTLPLLTIVRTREEFDETSAQIEKTNKDFRIRLSSMSTLIENESAIRQVESFTGQVETNILAITALIERRFEYIAEQQRTISDLEQLERDFQRYVLPILDDQLFYSLTGFRTISGRVSTRVERSDAVEIDKYRHLNTIFTSINQAIQTIYRVVDEPSIDALQVMQQQIDIDIKRVQRSLEYIGQDEVVDALEPYIDQIVRHGIGENSNFELRRKELQIVGELQDLVALNNGYVDDLTNSISEIVRGAQADTSAAAAITDTVILIVILVLLICNIGVLSGAIWTGWNYVGKRLIFRVEKISQDMVLMSEGQLDVEVDTSGNDEIAEMALALERFRDSMHAQERLTIVERMKEQLEQQNDLLEQTNENLKTAQTQVIANEKLAALGELTAGVAHEIKNPMNFIINFSEVSKELLDDLAEILDEGKEQLKEDADAFDMEEIDEICDDLNGNLDRITSHGQRANRIVMDMLSMGRGSAEWQPTDINTLLDTHTNLCVPRATWSGFGVSAQDHHRFRPIDWRSHRHTSRSRGVSF